MARETKAQREERDKLELYRREQELLAEWPARLMCNLERATHHSMKLNVVEGRFRVVWLDQWNDQEESQFNLVPSEHADWSAMDKLEYALDDADRREEEYCRKQALRASAASKLTKEEREELGLR